MTGPEMARNGLIRVTDRRSSAIQASERAFPKNPTGEDAGEGGAELYGAELVPSTVGPEAGSEPAVIVDGDALAAAMPRPGLVPMAWDGFPDAWTPAWSNVGGGGAGVGASMLQNRVSTVFTCVDLNGSALGSMPVALTERGRPMDPTMYAWTENPEPRLYSSWDEFVVQVYASLGTRGDAYVHATDWDWDTFLPSRFMVLDPDQVSVQFDDDGVRRYRLNGAELYTPDVLHLRYLTIPGWPNGLSPLQGAAGNLRSAAALESYGADLAERGGMTWGVLTSDQRITDRQADVAQSRWVQASARRRGAPAVLGNGLELKTLTLNPKDMALLDLRVFDEQRISAAYGVPPFLVGLDQPGGMTYSNVTSLFDFHWRRLRPVARRLTNALSAWALPPGRKVHLNAGDYVTPSLQERTPAYAAMSAAGALDTDEWRSIEGLPPRPPETDGQAAAAASPFANVGLPALVEAGIVSLDEARQLLGLKGAAPRGTVAAITDGGATLQ